MEAPKMFREMDGLELVNVHLPNAQETLWHCRNVNLKMCMWIMLIIFLCIVKILP